ncbi:MAG: gamma carbonic anhydrase family protein [Actinomycetota bacterium]|nr:MAG: gamma carbonic anhydrase family protein [Actinomycetota bacterium]
MAIYALGDNVPKIHSDAFIHPDAIVIGDVTIGPNSTIWPMAVLRGDYGAIVIGDDTSIQDGTVIHASAGLGTVIGSRCVVGHLAHLEGCTVKDDSLIGSGSIVLHRAIIESNALVGANSVVTNDTIIPSYSMALGVPAKIIRDRVKKDSFTMIVSNYVENGKRYKVDLRRID